MLRLVLLCSYEGRAFHGFEAADDVNGERMLLPLEQGRRGWALYRNVRREQIEKFRGGLHIGRDHIGRVGVLRVMALAVQAVEQPD